MLAVIVVIFGIIKPGSFLTVFNIRGIVQDTSILAVLGVGMTLVIITGGIDLSVGSVLVFSAVVADKAMAAMGGQGWGAALVGALVALAAGLAWGTLNGVLIARAKVPPLIVTLGTLGMALGLAEVITGGVDLRDVPTVMVNTVGFGNIVWEIPTLAVIAAVVVALGIVLLHRTRFGLHTYALGSSDDAAEADPPDHGAGSGTADLATTGRAATSMSAAAGAPAPRGPARRLDRKLTSIAAGRYTPGDFVIADAKDADMAFGLTAAGPAAGVPAGTAGPGRYRTRTEYLGAMRALAAQDDVDILLTSASNGERLATDGSLGGVTLAIRANDSTDIWNSRGGRYSAVPSRPFRTADLTAIRPFCDLVLYSLTFNNDLDCDLATVEAYRVFRQEAGWVRAWRAGGSRGRAG